MLTCFLSLFALMKLVVQRRKPQKILFEKQDVVWMIRHFTHQLFSYGFVAYKQCKSLNFVFSPFLMSQYVARSYWKLKGLWRVFIFTQARFPWKVFPCQRKLLVNICSLVSNRMELTTSLTLTVILVYVMEVVYSLFFVHCLAS